MAGRTLSHLQSHTAAVYIATRRGSNHWADSVCCLCCGSRLVSIAPPARKFLSAPPTSVICSAAGQIYSDRRSSLLGENAEKLLFLEYNIRLFDFKYRYWSLHAELMLPKDWRSEWYRLKCDHGFIKKYFFFVHLLFHVATDICKS